MKFIVVTALTAAAVILTGVAAAAPNSQATPHWSYEGSTGPAQWARLDAANEACEIGKTQSPINIPSANVGKSKLGAIDFAYNAMPLKVLDNGHTVQVTAEPGSAIIVGGQRYELKQFHFHHPSEEKIDGKSYALVAHLVHANAEGKLVVVGVLFEEGAENRALKTLWAHLPGEKERVAVASGTRFNPTSLLPATRSYYNFTGSLTTPPCSDGVNWFVLRTPVEASKEQIERFARRYPMNARPTQPLNGRAIDVGGM